jgi:hypothetical protein
MRPVVWAVMLALSTTPWAQAQDVRQPSDWKKLYEDALGQLRAAQTRKSDMATQIAQLSARVAALQTQLQAEQEQLDNLGIQNQLLSDRTYYLGAIYGEWEAFTLQNGDVRGRWRAFLGDGLFGFHEDFPLVCDPQWPFSLR